MVKKPYTAKEFFEIITKDIKKPDMIDYFRSSSQAQSKQLKNYEFTVTTEITYGSSEGIYLDVNIRGRYDENTSQNDIMTIGTFKTLNSNDEAVKTMYSLAAEVFLSGNRFLSENLNDFTWMGYAVKLKPEDKCFYEAPSEIGVIKRIAQFLQNNKDISQITILDYSTRKNLDPNAFITKAKEVAYGNN